MRVEYKVLEESDYYKINWYTLDELGLQGWIMCGVVDGKTFYFYRVLDETK